MKSNDKPHYTRMSPVPPHLTPEEREEWARQQEWDEQEVERRKKDGMYKPPKYKKKRGRPSKKVAEMQPFHSS